MKSIWIAGDFFRDEFNIGHMDPNNSIRFHVDETVTRPGGAANTLANARAICRNSAIQCSQAGYSDSRYLCRWTQDGQTVFEYWHVPPDGTIKPWIDLQRRSLKQLLEPEFKTLVVSEYNKGFSTCEVPPMPIFDLLVVDSRYRTAPIEDLKLLAKVSIWRCTGTEWDQDWADHFDYVVHTNHSNMIYVHGPEGGTPIVPPTVDAVDPVGAGDTFTAALAAALTDMGVVTHDTVVAAARFGSRAAADVCRKKFTATTNVRLEK